ncbi:MULTISPECIES: helix-turn-helix domain-containing protein [Erythrobacteraceae]|uniref:Helix-turn-helix transcriptional regulator n=1 Tax=Erythrobacter westpacificensis TaxID=1055231 RepID=A0ABP9KNH3_9SPHN|nr:MULTISPECIES: helix-turn-helix transcriptional regulator [Erythrobacteraceae]MCA0890013.1 helix-turn-helix domain-containing protein [Qipengyuania flava]WPZ05444.1 helix-turn-helix transcriptional regulator [Pelagerythrobacter marinus]|tara:strand:- start:1507 stop:2130 length:624 start_codon:yes stop_codon:yes gene_type:complete
MTTAIEDIAASIKAARTAKSFTQKQLGERVGLPQSHISKIEGGNVDLQISSLVEIARALDLELKLVPRRTVPAIEGVVRSQRERSEASRTLATIAETNRFAERVRESYPSVTEVNELQSALKDIQAVNFTPETLKAIEQALQPVAHLKKHLQDLGWALEQQEGRKKLAQQIAASTRALRHVRNLQVHSIDRDSAHRLPAYRLEDDAT